jgi:hypothetical protein
MIREKHVDFRQKLSALVAEVVFWKIYGVTARAEYAHPLPTIAAKPVTGEILVSASGTFHGKLLWKGAEPKMLVRIISFLKPTSNEER